MKYRKLIRHVFNRLAKYLDHYLEMRHWFFFLAKVSPSKGVIEGAENGEVRSKYLLVRILGNDHPPRHSENQTLNNLRFILENEPGFVGCRKLFILNRIYDTSREQELIDLLQLHSIEYIRIPFFAEDYSQVGWRMDVFGGPDFFASKDFLSMTDGEKKRKKIWAASPKICYAMNVNGARNVALEEGRCSAVWTFALDGNCTFTQENFDKLSQECDAKPYAPYVIIPMRRLSSNQALFEENDCNSQVVEEPQIGFHYTAKEIYNSELPYGVVDKAALLKRLGVPGLWQKWGAAYWINLPEDISEDRFFYKSSGCVVHRLSSGDNNLEEAGAQLARYQSRLDAILRTVELLDDKYGTIDEATGNLIYLNE